VLATLLALAAPAVAKDAPPPASAADFSESVLAADLSDPFEITFGPDGMLWVTERTAGRVTLVDPANGDKRTILTIPDVVSTEGEQDGLLGMALDPGGSHAAKRGRGRAHGALHVYLSYTYDKDPSPAVLDRRQRLVRYTYDRRARELRDPRTLIDNLLASDDHNSGRLVLGPDHKLYYTIGDRGNNQDLNACRLNEAQRLPTAAEVRARDWVAYQGKTLRLNTDGSIPRDNPVIDGVRSHVYTYGHRNAQGLVFGPRGRLYSSEQGPKSDDELNRLLPGGNYGWPRVAGYKDDSAYVYGNWSALPGCTPEAYNAFEIPAAVPQEAESTFNAPDFVPPLRTFYTVPPDFNFRAPTCAPSQLFFICYPTVAPSSLDVYRSRRIQGWADSLLMPTLKTGTVFRLPLLERHGTVVDGPLPLWRSVNRFRDTAIAPDGRTIYVATDSSGLAAEEAGTPTAQLENPGSILAFRYTGPSR
jgi:PQQ-dependent dehydrogenase (s-GDH family)